MLGIIGEIHISKKKPEKSYGVILGYDGESYFFRLNDKPFKEGMEVSYRGGKNGKGYYACEVQELNR